MVNLSLRLKTIASLVPFGARVCDVGTDHALLPIYLKQEGLAKSVIATDLNVKPLENAKKNLVTSGICDISLRLCDGLSGVTANEVDTVIIAGMGGEVIVNILKNCEWIKSNAISLILQPTTSAEELRRFLILNGFEIKSEIPVSENKKLYSVMTAKFTGAKLTYPEHFYFTGKIPLTAEGILYIKKQQKRLLECMNALENIENKKEEYERYKLLCQQIEKLLTEN